LLLPNQIFPEKVLNGIWTCVMVDTLLGVQKACGSIPNLWHTFFLITVKKCIPHSLSW